PQFLLSRAGSAYRHRFAYAQATAMRHEHEPLAWMTLPAASAASNAAAIWFSERCVACKAGSKRASAVRAGSPIPMLDRSLRPNEHHRAAGLRSAGAVDRLPNVRSWATCGPADARFGRRRLTHMYGPGAPGDRQKVDGGSPSRCRA